MGNNKFKILVVEDDKSVSRMLQTVLENNGYQVLTAYKCQQGILMLSSHVPDLVVLDLGLPDMDGEEFIRIARRSSMIPIIVLSARTDEKDKVSALDLGATRGLAFRKVILPDIMPGVLSGFMLAFTLSLQSTPE